jgi:tripartite-type tricarboxylate transporter receptor subunit TctC
MRTNRETLLRACGVALVGISVCATLANNAGAQADSFYTGKTIRIILGVGPGGAADVRLRSFIDAFQKHIPGKPTIVVEYMEGGGGRKAANYIYSTARPDGLTIGSISSAFLIQAILGETGIHYDIDKLIFLGSHRSGLSRVFLTHRKAGLDTLEKLRGASGVRFGAQSVGHTTYYSNRIFAYLVGMKDPKFVTGFSGNEIDVAIMTGELDARSISADLVIQRTPEWIQDKLMHFHAILNIPKEEKHSNPFFAQLPDLEQFARTDRDRRLTTMFRTFQTFGSPFVLPPGTVKERVKTLQGAIRNAFKDPEFEKKFEKLTGEDAKPQTPDEIETLIKEIPREPADIELFKKLAGPDNLPTR